MNESEAELPESAPVQVTMISSVPAKFCEEVLIVKAPVEAS